MIENSPDCRFPFTSFSRTACSGDCPIAVQYIRRKIPPAKVASEESNPMMNIAMKVLSTILTMAAFIIACYTLSVLWRINNAEQSNFGRSDLFPTGQEQKQFDQPPSPESYGKNTYTHIVRGRSVQVYEELIHSFQHLYGSALVSSEIGELGADLLFKANEYFEAIISDKSGTLTFYLDTKKDLANNEVGRKIGSEVKASGLSGANAEQFMIDKIFMALDGGRAYKNHSEFRVTQLPSLDDSGCPLLRSIQELRRPDKTVELK